MLWQLIIKGGKRFRWMSGAALGLSLVVSTVAPVVPGIDASSPAVETSHLNTSLAEPRSLTGAAAIKDCNNYYFRSDSVNVGVDGHRPVADRTAPIADTPTVASATLTGDTEIARFYSHPPLAETWQLSEDITGVIWINTSRSTTTTLNIQMFDYNPATGAKASLGDFPVTLLSEGETTLEFNLSPPVASIAAGHRLLFVLEGKKGAPPSRVDLFYNSRARASRFSICRHIQGEPSTIMVYLPIVSATRVDPQTALRVDSINTGGINPVRVLNPITNQELLRCTVGNNVVQVCGSFPTPANGTYKITASTQNCGFLQGTFSDATPGGTVTRRIFCN